MLLMLASLYLNNVGLWGLVAVLVVLPGWFYFPPHHSLQTFVLL